ncbi:MAG: aminoglycoside 6-adenylyltransferase [Herpetosiphonaceae bacterium]|nr:aminoglycoside 6-adenylyltransferase [Herpetosiphonaceae bacterium]
MQQEYIQALIAQTEPDGRIKAAWLAGSFGRGNADRYSDLDIHLLLDESDLHDFKASVEAWLSRIRPLVLFNLLFNDTMVNALTEDGLRLDVWLHGEKLVSVDPAKTQILFQTGNVVQYEHVAEPRDPSTVAKVLLRQTKEFWRCISLLPPVVGRKELIVAFAGLTVETNILTDVLISGYGIARESGVKRLNVFLPDDIRQSIEDALSMQDLSQVSLAEAQMKLARIMEEHGRIIAAKHSYPYPDELEAAVLGYVHKELALLGLDTAFPSSDA